MNAEQFSDFRHAAVHELKQLNENCNKQFYLDSWPRWNYDLERGTLTFSWEDVPKVIATIQVVGTTSISGGTWLWGWANAHLPVAVTKAIEKVRELGKAEGLTELTRAKSKDDKFLGWEMTAIAAKVLGAKGAYRCPGENGFIYVVYAALRFTSELTAADIESGRVKCATHGSGFETFACEHLISNPAQEWFFDETDNETKWPDAWCAACNTLFQQEGEWNERNESNVKIKLLCHQCYERFRSQALKS